MFWFTFLYTFFFYFSNHRSTDGCHDGSNHRSVISYSQSTRYPLFPVDPDTKMDVATAGAGEIAIVYWDDTLIPLFAFGKQDATEKTRAFEDFVNTVMKVLY